MFIKRLHLSALGGGVCVCVSSTDESGCLCVQESRYMRCGAQGAVALAEMPLLFSNHSAHLHQAHS